MNFLRRGTPKQQAVKRSTKPSSDVTSNELMRISWDNGAQAVKASLMEHVASNRVEASSAEIVNLYSTGVAVYAATNFIGLNLGLVRYEIRDENGKAVDHPIQQVFERDFDDIQRRTSYSLSLKGESLAQILRYPSPKWPIQLQWINFNSWQPQYNGMGEISRFIISRNPYSQAQIDSLDIKDAVFLHSFDPRNDYQGTSPAEVAYQQAGVNVEIATTQLAYFQNFAIPALHIQPTADSANSGIKPSLEDRNQLATLLRRVMQGAGNFGKNLITPVRWEINKYQADFDTLSMDTLNLQAIQQVFMAFGVPVELAMPSASGYAQAYEARRGWLETRLKPEAEWYARQYAKQIVHPFFPKWKVVPIFDNVPGFRLDIAQRTTTNRDMMMGGLATWYDAVKLQGVSDPPESFKKLWWIQGLPIPEDKVPEYYLLTRSGGAGGLDGATQKPIDPKQAASRPTEGGAPLAPQAERPTSSGSGSGKSIDFLPDPIFHELKNWKSIVSRKGASAAFETRELPADVGAYGHFLLTSGMEVDNAFADIRSEYVQSATKDYNQTALNYRKTFYDLLTSAFSGIIDRKQFGDLGRAEVSQAFRSAYFDGLATGGVNTTDLDPAEQDELDLETKSERQYFTKFANEVYTEVLPLLKQAQAARDAGDPKAEELFAQFNAKRDWLIQRVDMWVNAARSMHELGLSSAKKNQMLKWVYDPTIIEHCKTCDAANGQVHRARDWKRYGLRPGVHSLECRGVHCGCAFQPTTERASGSLKSIPLHADDGEDVPAKKSTPTVAPTIADGHCSLLRVEASPDLLALQKRVIDTSGVVGEFTEPSDFHITLCYAVGGTPDKWQRFTVTGLNEAIPLIVDGVGVFDTPDGYAVYAIVRKTDQLALLQKQQCALAVADGFDISPHSSDYVPHITLAYLQQPFAPFTVDPFPIMANQIELSSPDYEPIALMALKAQVTA